jgi:hypothetical protein
MSNAVPPTPPATPPPPEGRSGCLAMPLVLAKMIVDRMQRIASKPEDTKTETHEKPSKKVSGQETINIRMEKVQTQVAAKSALDQIYAAHRRKPADDMPFDKFLEVLPRTLQQDIPKLAGHFQQWTTGDILQILERTMDNLSELKKLLLQLLADDDPNIMPAKELVGRMPFGFPKRYLVRLVEIRKFVFANELLIWAREKQSGHNVWDTIAEDLPPPPQS